MKTIGANTTPIEANELTSKGYVDSSTSIPAAVIWDYAGSGSPPPGWLLCDGSEVSRSGITANLFAAIGTIYGTGDGSTTFNVPDCRKRVLVGSGVSLGSNDGLAFDNRLLSHSHTVSGHTHSAPAHYHANHLTIGTESSHQHSMDHDHQNVETVGGGAHTHVGGGTYTHTDVAGSYTGIAIGPNRALWTQLAGGDHTHNVDLPNYTGSTGGGSSHNHTLTGVIGLAPPYGEGANGDAPMTTGSSGSGNTGGTAAMPYLIVNKIIKL